MLLKSISFSDPVDNLLYDDVLLKLAEQGRGGEVLRLWEPPSVFIVLGRSSKAEDDVDLNAARRSNVPVLRRSSGGGTVVQAPGCLNFSLIVSKDRPGLNDIRRSYRMIQEGVLEVLAQCGIASAVRPVSDIALSSSDKKISGNAQRRGRRFILHHGTLLVHFDIEQMSRLLRFPKAVPDYRAGRSHEAFVANIPVTMDALKQAFCEVYQIDREVRELTAEEGEILAALKVPGSL